jgi:nitronate monooxygenase
VAAVLRTRFTDLFGIDHPVMSAPMALHSGGTLAGAVTAAGGLGSFGGINPSGGPDWIREQVAIVRAATDGPFAVGYITAFLEYARPLLEATLEAGTTAVALSFGDPRPWIPVIRDAGAKVICQVQTPEAADVAVGEGADLVVVQGNEAGGHTGTLGLLPFLASVAERHPDVPLLAAGGIADGRTLAAAMVAGADGAWLGTAFLATPEAVEVDDDYRARIVASDGTDTVFTHVHDILSGLPWPAGIGERVQRDEITDRWGDREEELVARRAEVAAELGRTSPVRFGPSAALVPAVRPAADVVRSISADAEAVLRSRPGALLS